MATLRQIRRGIDYIEDSLGTDLDPAEVARHAGLSRWHFQRIFKSLTNETLKTYIRSRRFARALEALTSSDVPILGIALAAGFESQESFTRAFKKAFGMTPGAARRHRPATAFLRKARFDAAYLRHLDRNLSRAPDLYEQPALELVGVTTRLFGPDSDKSDFARALPALWDRFLRRLGELERRAPGVAYGAVRPVSPESDALRYLAAVEVVPGATVPPGMVRFCLPAARYARFRHRGPVETIDRTLNYVYSSWLLTSQLRHSGGWDLELYDARYRPGSEDSVMHYAIPVAEAAER